MFFKLGFTFIPCISSVILKSFIVLSQEIVNILGRLLISKEKYLFFVGFFIKFVYFNVSIVS
jgi:hypothetical protein